MWCVEFSNKVKWNTDTHHITLSAKYFQITRLLHLKGKKNAHLLHQLSNSVCVTMLKLENVLGYYITFYSLIDY